MSRGKAGNAFFQEAPIEISIVGDDEHSAAQEYVDSLILNAVARNHLIGNAGDLRDLGGIEKPRSLSHSQEPRTL
jgi:hypothetical protein